jgi:hypothetical protein
VTAAAPAHAAAATAPKAKAATGAPARAPRAATLPAGLPDDCADGTIDGDYTRAQLRLALQRSSDGAGEYGGCRQALLTASLD